MEKSRLLLPPCEASPYSKYSKICSPTSYLKLFQKTNHQKAKLLKELEQLNIDTSNLRDSTIQQIQEQCEGVLKNSYSVKYIGVKENRIGILSRRVRPDDLQSDSLPKIEDALYLVTGYFYPKPLKTIHNSIDKGLTLDNLQSQIKKSFPKHEKKQIDHSVKLKGSWTNLKCHERTPSHLRYKPCTLPSINKNYSSYSRTLQQKEVIQSIVKTEATDSVVESAK